MFIYIKMDIRNTNVGVAIWYDKIFGNTGWPKNGGRMSKIIKKPCDMLIFTKIDIRNLSFEISSWYDKIFW